MSEQKEFALPNGDSVTLIAGDSLEVDWVTLRQSGIPYLSGRGKNCEITLEQRPPYCDRGRWVAKVHPDPGSQLQESLDWADGWPRYYFDLTRGLLELEAWLRKRGQLSNDRRNPCGSAPNDKATNAETKS